MTSFILSFSSISSIFTVDCKFRIIYRQFKLNAIIIDYRTLHEIEAKNNNNGIAICYTIRFNDLPGTCKHLRRGD